MSTGETLERLTYAEAARIVRDMARGNLWKTTSLGARLNAYLTVRQSEDAPNTAKTYKGVLSELAVYYADLDLPDFEPPMGTDRCRQFLIDRYTTQAGGKPYAVKTRALVHSALSEYFAYEVLRGHLYGNPMGAIKKPRGRGVRRRAMPLGHAHALIASHRGRDQIGLTLLLVCGLRREELRLVQFDHFDLPHDELVLVGEKGGGMSVVKVPRSLCVDVEREILRRAAAPDEYLLYPVKVGPVGRRSEHRTELVAEYRDRPLSYTAVHNWWKRCLREAGLPGTWKLHEMRHTAISEFMRANKGDVLAAKEFARHASIQTTYDIYGHLADEHMVSALDAFYAHLREDA